MNTTADSISRKATASIAAVYAIIIVFGSLSNGVIIATYIRWRRSMFQTPRDMLTFSLAVGDFIMSSMVCPFGFASTVAHHWTAGRYGCVWYGFTSTWIGLSSMLQLANISIERYRTLSRTTVSQNCKKWKAFIAFSWSFSFLTCCFPLFGWSSYVFEGLGLYCAIDWETKSFNNTSYSLFLLIVYFAIPVTVVLVSYIKVYIIVKQMSRNACKTWGSTANATAECYRAEVKVAKQMFIVTLGFMFAWTPYAIMSLLVAFTDYRPSNTVHTLPALFAKTANVYNPIIYFFTYKKLMTRAQNMFKDVAGSLMTNLPDTSRERETVEMDNV